MGRASCPHTLGVTVMSTDASLLEEAQGIAVRLGVSPETVRLWARRGLIPAVRITRKVVRFEWERVVAALRERGGLSAGAGR